MKQIVLSILLLLYFNNVQSQDCKVLLNTINSTYTGDCKKEKADGEGLAKGIDTYKGQFVKGKKQGKGVFTEVNAAVVEGFWKNDKYVGLYKKPYNKIDKSSDVSSISIKEMETKEQVHRIRFYLKASQQQVYNPKMNFVLHNGSYQDIKNNNGYIELYNVQFPIKLKAYAGSDYFEIEILKAGFWDVYTEITKINGLNTRN